MLQECYGDLVLTNAFEELSSSVGRMHRKCTEVPEDDKEIF